MKITGKAISKRVRGGSMRTPKHIKKATEDSVYGFSHACECAGWVTILNSLKAVFARTIAGINFILNYENQTQGL